jgi:DNA invertase Pin-like site-specific DNA recombinase
VGTHRGKYVAYFRCASDQRHQSSLDLDTQKAAVAAYLNGGNWQIVAELLELEEDGKNSRPQLRAAISAARRTGAVLLVARLFGLTHSAPFLKMLLDSGVRFKAVDMPEADRSMFQFMATLAQWEFAQISRRQKDALQAAKARGIRLGNPRMLASSNQVRRVEARVRAERLRPTLERLRGQGLSHREMVDELNRLGVPSARGGRWSLMPLQRVLKRLERASVDERPAHATPSPKARPRQRLTAA